MMTKTGLAVILLLIVCKSHAQQDCLILIDADNEKPFYARVDDKIFSSSPVGHLSIPHLKDSTYIIAIGFSGNAYPEYRFAVLVTKKEQGFQLRNSGEKGWALYNWQTMELKTALPADTGNNPFALQRGIKKDDPFSRLMANVVNDSLVMYNTYIEEKIIPDSTQKIPEPKPVLMQVLQPPVNNPAVDAGTVAAPIIPAAKPAQKTKKGKADDRAPIVKLKESRTKTAVHLVYLDRTNAERTDTIRMIIPFEAEALPLPKTDSSTATETLKPVGTQAGSSVKKTASILPCKNTASDYDIDAVRVSILTENTLDAKIEAARKFFKLKCVAVSQVKALSELFLYDKNRLELFQAAYPSVTDKDNFPQLGGLIKDPIYQKQFNESF
jgi:Domain of unknown function (DUF4476)